MMDKQSQEKYQLGPIGRIMVSEGEGRYIVAVDVPFREGLKHLDQFSHVMVFWWADRMDTVVQRQVLTTSLPYAPGEEAGVFACRSEYRPNPIAVTTLPILGVDVAAGIVVLPWIDALDGTPLIDLKPYIPVSDRIRDVRVAPWMADWPVWMEEAGAYFAENETDFGD